MFLGTGAARLAAAAALTVLAVLAGAPPAVADPTAGTAGTAGRSPGDPGAATTGGPTTGTPTTGTPTTGTPTTGSPTTGAPARRRPGDDTSAGVLQGWGAPSRVDDFDGTRLGSAWDVYDGPGHGGNGRRTPKAVGVRDGVLTVTGDARGNTAGMEWGSTGQRYGRWEGRVKAPASDESYDALLLLWPDAENFPVGGEIDFMEMMDHTRQTTNVFLHYGKRNRQVSGEVRVDATQWHDWAVEWTPTRVTTFLDGRPWWRTDRAGILPPGPMHLCVQLDWFPDSARGPVQRSTMQVDWVKQWTLRPSARSQAAPDDGPARVVPATGSATRARSGPGAG